MKSILIIEEEKRFNDFSQYKQIVEKKYKINEFENLYFAFVRHDQINHHVCTFLNVKNRNELIRQDFGNFLSIDFNQDLTDLLFKDFNKNDEIVILYKHQFSNLVNQIGEKLKISLVNVYTIEL